MVLINDSSASVTPPDIVDEVFDATGGGQGPVDTQTAPGGFGEVVSFDLADGHYKIRATADGYQESGYTASSGRYSDSFRELLGYQERKTFATADEIEIVVDLVTGTSSSTSEGWTVLHPSESSISGAVGNDVSAQQGSLLADVAVELYDAAAPDPEAGRVAFTETDGNGYYTFLQPCLRLLPDRTC
ncbi:hypothetical protein ACVWY0_003632 [Arthrobacter sp. UYNi723]